MFGDGIAGITDASTTRKPVETAHTQIAVDDGALVLAHPAGAAGVIDRAAHLANVGGDLVIGLQSAIWPHLLGDQRAERLGRGDLLARSGSPRA